MRPRSTAAAGLAQLQGRDLVGQRERPRSRADGLRRAARAARSSSRPAAAEQLGGGLGARRAARPGGARCRPSRLRSSPRAWAVASLRTIRRPRLRQRLGRVASDGSASIASRRGDLQGRRPGRPEPARLETELGQQLGGPALGLVDQGREQVQRLDGLAPRDAAPPSARPGPAPRPQCTIPTSGRDPACPTTSGTSRRRSADEAVTADDWRCPVSSSCNSRVGRPSLSSIDPRKFRLESSSAIGPRIAGIVDPTRRPYVPPHRPTYKEPHRVRPVAPADLVRRPDGPPAADLRGRRPRRRPRQETDLRARFPGQGYRRQGRRPGQVSRARCS